jgi:hypothetical protein
MTPVPWNLSTYWERMSVSEATARHLRLDNHHVWSRITRGLIHYLVLRARQKPAARDMGWLLIQSAVTNKGRHR